jgi:hypothetical protein
VHDHTALMEAEARALREEKTEANADLFERLARRRFSLVVEEFLASPDDAPIIVEGRQLLPDLVAPLLASPQQVWTR